MKNELVVGSSGVFGSTYLKERNNNGDVAINRENFKSIYNFNLSEKRNLEKLLDFIKTNGISRIVYAAQHSDYRTNSAENRLDLLNINSHFVSLFAKACMELAIPITYFSSGSVYTLKNSPIKESDPLNYEGNFYVSSKLAAEFAIKTLNIHEISLILRPFFMFGKNQKITTMVPGLFKSIINRTEINLNCKKGMLLNPIFAQQAVNLVGQLHSHNASGTYNLAGNEVTSVRELSLYIGRLLNIEPRFVIDSKFSSASSVVGDISKLNQFTEQDPAFNLNSGLKVVGHHLKFI
jgi:UDP-glucose 4-epimerase